MAITRSSNYRWFILALAVTTQASVMAMRLSLPVLFKEISDELGLSIASLGAIWGMDPLAGVFISLPAGLIVDRFGIKRTLTVVCFLQGVAGALRGLSFNFVSMAASMFFFGIVCAMTPTLMSKVISVWFRGRDLGKTQSMIMIGAGVGSIVSTMLSATLFSPLLGGWRNVLFLYAAVPVIMSLLWLVTGREPDKTESPAVIQNMVPFRQSLSHVVHIKQVWLVGLSQMCLNGAFQGLMGYLSLYLQIIGWTQASADGALTILTGISCLGAFPVVLLSYRIGSRKWTLIMAFIISSVSLGLLPLVRGPAVWVILAINGFLRSGTQTLFVTTVLETEGVSGAYAGTALGLEYTLAMLGGFLSPTLGNRLADIGTMVPFIFWATLSAAALPILSFVKENGGERREIIHR